MLMEMVRMCIQKMSGGPAVHDSLFAFLNLKNLSYETYIFNRSPL